MKINWFLFLLKNSFRNLWRSPRRTLISLVAIGAAACSLVIFQSFTKGVEAAFRRNVITSAFGHYQIFKKGFREDGTQNTEKYAIKNADEIRKAIESEIAPLAFMSQRLEFYGLLNFGDLSLGGRGFGIDAAEEEKFLTLNRVAQGEHLAKGPDNGIFLGIGIAKRLGVKVGDMLTLLVTTSIGSINAADMVVTGIFNSGVPEMDEQIFYVKHPQAEALVGIEGAPRILIGFQDDNELQYKAALEKLVSERYPDLEVVHWHKLADFFFNTMAWLESQYLIFRVIILLIASLSIINVFTITLLERIGEFGTMRAIGTYRSEIAGMIFVEGLLQAAIGSFAGVGVAIAIIELFLKGGILMPPPPLMSVPMLVISAVPWQQIPGILLLCIGLSGGAAIFPAIRMARSNIVHALGRNV